MGFNQTIPFLFIGVVAAVIVGSLIYGRVYARKRTEALQLVAAQLGFSFAGAEQDHHSAIPDLMMPLFNRGRGRKFSNSMTGSFAGQRISIFDYRFTTGSGKDSHTWNQTVAAFSQELWLPEFELRAENFLDRIADHFTHRDIDFDAFPEFSRRFLLRGPSENGIRKLFAPALIQFLQMLAQDVKWNIEGSSATLVIYSSDSTIPSDLDSYRSFLEKTSEIAKAFFSTPENLSQPVR